MTTSRKNKNPPNYKKRAVIATCLIFLLIAVVFLHRTYHPSLTTRPQKMPPSTESTKSVTEPSETVASQNVEEPSNIRQHQLQEADRQFLIEKGLQEPINDLVKDLMKHNELIPCEGTVGGTPGFYNPDRIAVLSKDHVIADYDDGHVEGTVELTFTVSNGTISWTVTQAECGD
jgi:hypothetical protein